MNAGTTWQVCLARVPGPRVESEDFALHDVSWSDPAAGEVVVRTEALGLNAGLRHRLGTGRATTLGPALEVGDVPCSDGVATILASGERALPVGSRVVGLLPWRGTSSVPADALRRVDARHSTRELLTIRGHVGLTAFVALTRVGGLRPGDTVWISAAAGGVGTCAVQFAQLLGGRVLGSAGGPPRVRFLAEKLGVRHALDRTDDLAAQLDAAAPDGIDLYLDLVGGDHVDLALARMRVRGRVVLVGRAGADQTGVISLDHPAMVLRRLAVLGMSVTDHADALPDLLRLIEGAAVGLEPVASVWHTPAALGEAFAALCQGRVRGRAIVDVGMPAAPVRDREARISRRSPF